MKRSTGVRFVLTVVLALQSAPALAQEAEKTKEVLAAELIEITGGGSTATEMIQAMSAQLRLMYGTVPDPVWNEMFGEVEARELAALIVPIYAKRFSRDDLRDLVAFYRTPLGQRLVEATPGILEESMLVGGEWAQLKAAEIVERLRAKGYEPTQIPTPPAS